LKKKECLYAAGESAMTGLHLKQIERLLVNLTTARSAPVGWAQYLNAARGVPGKVEHFSRSV
jgi:hypothetical protein